MNKSDELANESDLSDEDFCPDNEAASELSEESSDDEIEDDDDNSHETATKVTKKASKSSKKKLKNKSIQQNETQTKRNTRQKAGEVGATKQETKLEKAELESDDDEKARADALWADFLGDVKQTTTPTEQKEKKTLTKTAESPKRNHSKTSTTAAVDLNKSDTPNGKHTDDLENNEGSAVDEPKQVTITEILDFAGEEIQVQKVVSAESIKENKSSTGVKNVSTSSTSTSRPTIGVKRPTEAGSSGLGSILNQIGKKKKISVLEKTKLDWNSFKKDEGIEEELQTFNKGKDGYLERQDFLQRTDVRQFEIEKNLRQTRRNH